VSNAFLAEQADASIVKANPVGPACGKSQQDVLEKYQDPISCN
jgi:hypothetical protein